MHWWVMDFVDEPQTLIFWVFWVIFSIVLHELGHGWAALRVGDDTPRVMGHMTWNPLVHMGIHSFIVFAVIGIAWGAMPVDPTRFRGRHAEALVAAAGPSMNLGIGLTAAVLAACWLRWGGSLVEEHVFENTLSFLTMGAMLNLTLMIVNLMPVPPLDGSKILATYVRSYRSIIYGDNGPMIALAGMIILFGTIGSTLFALAAAASAIFIGVLAGLLP